jgi:hypothetical protein
MLDFEKHKKWFDEDCMVLKRDLKLIGRRLRENPYNQMLLVSYRSKKKKFKSLQNKKKMTFKSEILSQMEMLQSQNPSEYWSLFD